MAVMPAVEAPPVELSSVILEVIIPLKPARYTTGEMALAAEGNMSPSQTIASSPFGTHKGGDEGAQLNAEVKIKLSPPGAAGSR
jgi:hypothetical protein